MSKRYPIKLAKVCSLFIVLLGILIPSLYIYVGADGLTVIDVVIASCGVVLVLVGLTLLFRLPRYHKLLVAMMSTLSILSSVALVFYWYVLQMGANDGYIDAEVVTRAAVPILPPVACIGLFIWLMMAAHGAEKEKR